MLAGTGQFFHIIFAADYRDQAKFGRQSDHALYGKKQQADRRAYEETDCHKADFTNANGFIDCFVLHTITEWKNELDFTGFPA